MTGLCLVLLGLSVVPTLGRNPRSLTDTFPFNLQEDAQDQGHDAQVDNDVGVDRASRQDHGDSAKSFPFSDVASSYAEGKRCIDKVFMEEITEWDTEYTCHHSYNRRCAKSLTTTYNTVQEQECEENYVKKCFIEYTAYAQNVTVNVCRTPLVKDCDQQGEELCTTEYESECVTEQLEHQVEDDVPECKTVVDEKCEEITSGYTSSQQCSKWPREECVLSKQNRKKYSPQTRCEKIPVTLCGPAGCGFVEGDEVCYERRQTIVGDKPEETCSLDPQTKCRHVTKLVPVLKEVESCFNVPKEVCVREQRNPRKVAKPVIKKWCYVVSCPDECVEAAKEGQCPAQCKENEGNSRCCAPCSLTCQNAARNDQCPRECAQYEGNTKCCRREPRIIDECEPECKAAASRGECTNECYRKYRLLIPECCRTCPNICKQFARDEKTFKNATLDCSVFEDKLCYFECPKRCADAFKRGETRLDCKNYTSIPNCYKPPPCPQRCLDAAKNEQCPRDCNQFKKEPKCCFECPQICKDSFGRGESDKQCQRYSHLPDCYKIVRTPPPPPPTTCPAKCTNKRQKECRAGGVPECDGIPGCCPEKYDLLFGSGVFLENENQ